jgi:hypothetical protein
VKAAVKAAAKLLGMDYRPGQQAEGEATDWRPVLADAQRWVLSTIPPALQGATRRTDGRNVKLATAILERMHRYNTTQLHISLRTLALDAGVNKDAAHRGLSDLGKRLFTVEVQHKAMTVITLNMDGCLAEMRQKNRADPDLSHLPQATAVYVERMGTDPFLIGASQKVKELARQAAMVTGKKHGGCAGKRQRPQPHRVGASPTRPVAGL